MQRDNLHVNTIVGQYGGLFFLLLPAKGGDKTMKWRQFLLSLTYISTSCPAAATEHDTVITQLWERRKILRGDGRNLPSSQSTVKTYNYPSYFYVIVGMRSNSSILNNPPL